jgi:hypothetical protein
MLSSDVHITRHSFNGNTIMWHGKKLPVKPGSILRFSSLHSLKSNFNLKGEKFWKFPLHFSFLLCLPSQQNRGRFFPLCHSYQNPALNPYKKLGSPYVTCTSTQAYMHTHVHAHRRGRMGWGLRYKVYLKIGFPRVLTSGDGRQIDLQKVGVRTLSQGWNQQLMHEPKLWLSPA